jgi:hypothetical protein
MLVFKSTPPKRTGVDCDVIVQTVNAHLTVVKYCRLTNEIIDYKIVALLLIFNDYKRYELYFQIR